VLLLGTLAKVCHPINDVINKMDFTETSLRVKKYLKTTFEVFKNEFNWTKIDDIIFFQVSRMMDQTFVDLYEINLSIPDIITSNYELFK
jgi:hypothetical protein